MPTLSAAMSAYTGTARRSRHNARRATPVACAARRGSVPVAAAARIAALAMSSTAAIGVCRRTATATRTGAIIHSTSSNEASRA